MAEGRRVWVGVFAVEALRLIVAPAWETTLMKIRYFSTGMEGCRNPVISESVNSDDILRYDVCRFALGVAEESAYFSFVSSSS